MFLEARETEESTQLGEHSLSLFTVFSSCTAHSPQILQHEVLPTAEHKLLAFETHIILKKYINLKQ